MKKLKKWYRATRKIIMEMKENLDCGTNKCETCLYRIGTDKCRCILAEEIEMAFKIKKVIEREKKESK